MNNQNRLQVCYYSVKQDLIIKRGYPGKWLT